MFYLLTYGSKIYYDSAEEIRNEIRNEKYFNYTYLRRLITKFNLDYYKINIYFTHNFSSLSIYRTKDKIDNFDFVNIWFNKFVKSDKGQEIILALFNKDEYMAYIFPLIKHKSEFHIERVLFYQEYLLYEYNSKYLSKELFDKYLEVKKGFYNYEFLESTNIKYFKDLSLETKKQIIKSNSKLMKKFINDKDLSELMLYSLSLSGNNITSFLYMKLSDSVKWKVIKDELFLPEYGRFIINKEMLLFIVENDLLMLFSAFYYYNKSLYKKFAKERKWSRVNT